MLSISCRIESTFETISLVCRILMNIKYAKLLDLGLNPEQVHRDLKFLERGRSSQKFGCLPFQDSRSNGIVFPRSRRASACSGFESRTRDVSFQIGTHRVPPKSRRINLKSAWLEYLDRLPDFGWQLKTRMDIDRTVPAAQHAALNLNPNLFAGMLYAEPKEVQDPVPARLPNANHVYSSPRTVRLRRRNNGQHAVDGQNPAPPKKPWNDLFACKCLPTVGSHGFKIVRNGFHNHPRRGPSKEQRSFVPGAEGSV